LIEFKKIVKYSLHIIRSIIWASLPDKRNQLFTVCDLSPLTEM